jgi:hypothetical protein
MTLQIVYFDEHKFTSFIWMDSSIFIVSEPDQPLDHESKPPN